MTPLFQRHAKPSSPQWLSQFAPMLRVSEKLSDSSNRLAAATENTLSRLSPKNAPSYPTPLGISAPRFEPPTRVSLRGVIAGMVLAAVVGLAAVAFAGCAQDDISTPAASSASAESALVTSACTAYQPVRTLDVGYSFGSCVRYTVPYTAYTAVIYQVPPPAGNPGNIVSVRTGTMAAAWACDTSAPRGFAESPDAPCWSGSTHAGVVARVRGAYSGGYYQGQSAVIGAGGVGRSLVVSEGNLPGPPPCAYTLTPSTADDPLHTHLCNLDPDAQVSGEVKQNYAPDDSDNCCNVSTTWPDGDSGRSCTTNAATNVGYATVWYPPCPLH